jgi:uncharacterized protein with HEPN domain
MSKPKIEFIIQMIDDIEFIVNEHGSVTGVLSHRIYKPAILMSLLQIGETLHKLDILENENLKEYSKGAYNVRNFIAHDYEGVNLAIIEHIIRNLLVPLKDELIKEKEKFS